MTAVIGELVAPFDAPTRGRQHRVAYGRNAGPKRPTAPAEPRDDHSWQRSSTGAWRPPGFPDQPHTSAPADVPRPTGAAGHDAEWKTHLGKVATSARRNP